MATVLEVKRVTPEEISADLEKLVQEEFQMDLPTFFTAVEAKTLCADNDLVREILSWARLASKKSQCEQTQPK